MVSSSSIDADCAVGPSDGDATPYCDKAVCEVCDGVVGADDAGSFRDRGQRIAAATHFASSASLVF